MRLAIDIDAEAVLIIDCTNSGPAYHETPHVGHLMKSSPPPKSTRGPNTNLEMLARAYCSENGINALISRKGRTCLSCSIREARALNVRVVIRIGA